MKSAKRAIVLFTALIYFAVSAFSVNAVVSQSNTDNTNDYAQSCMELLIDIDVLDDELVLDDIVTRETYSAYISKFLDGEIPSGSGVKRYYDVEASDEHYSAIEYLSVLGIVSGDGNGFFHPERPVTGYEAAKMMVEILGYRYYARNKGGYPYGYMSVADELKLLKGIQLNGEYISGSDFVILLSNALDVKVAKVSSLIAEGDQYHQVITTDRDETVLSGMDMYRSTGTLTSYFPVCLRDGVANNGNVVIDRNEFRVDNLSVSEFLGCDVEYIYLEKDNVKTLKHIAYDEECNVTVLTGSRLIDVYGMNISYTDENNKIVKKSVSSTADVLYNFEKVPFNESYITEPEYAKFILVDNGSNNEIDVLLIETYSAITVKGKSNNLKILYGMDGADDTLSLNPDNYDEVLILSEDGDKITFDDIKPGNTLIYASSDNFIKCYVSAKNVSGKMTAKVLGTPLNVTVNGTDYPLSSELSDVDGFIGYEVKAYLDANGYISYIENTTVPAVRFGFLLDTKYSEGLVDRYDFLIFAEDDDIGSAISFECSERIKLNGVTTQRSDLPEEIPQGVVAFALDESGKLNLLETVVDRSEFEDGRLYCALDDTSSFHYQANGSFSGKTLYDGNTIMYQITAERGAHLTEDDIRVSELSGLETDSYANVRLYSVSNDGVADVVLLYKAASEETIPNSGNNFIAISQTGYVLDENGNDRYIVSGLKTGKEVEFTVHSDYIEEIKNLNLQSGDVCRYAVRGAQEELTQIEVLYRVDGGWQGPNPWVEGSNPGSVPYIAYGEVVNVDSDYIYYSYVGDNNSGKFLSDYLTYPKYRWSAITVIEINSRGAVIRTGTMEDIEPGDEVINYTWRLHPEGFAVIKK